MSGEDRSSRARLFRAVAALAEPFYRAAVAWRNRCYDGGRSVHQAHCPVLSVGNLTTGGTGKTPMVIDLVERLRRAGRTPAVVLRGYMAGRGPSDEAGVYANRLPGVPIVVNPDRVAAAEHLRQTWPEVDVLVLDDAFQHRRLARDVDLVLIDATEPWGYGRVLPRGMLREPPQDLGRATAVVVTHADALDDAGRGALRDQIARHHGKPPIAWTQHIWRRLVDAEGHTVATDASRRVVAFCGIGNPGAFLDEAQRRFELVDAVVFSDHQDYGPRARADIELAARRHQPDALLTTEKDWVKLTGVLDRLDTPPIWRPMLGITHIHGEDDLTQLLADALTHHRPDPPPS